MLSYVKAVKVSKNICSGARRADRGGFLNHRVSGIFPTSSDSSSATNCGAVLHSTQGPHIAKGRLNLRLSGRG